MPALRWLATQVCIALRRCTVHQGAQVARDRLRAAHLGDRRSRSVGTSRHSSLTPGVATENRMESADSDLLDCVMMI